MIFIFSVQHGCRLLKKLQSVTFIIISTNNFTFCIFLIYTIPQKIRKSRGKREIY
ncbi:hypothetical protein ANACOL_01239 [Anaerotruncus colihominis DSM 17241]|uniref:Uncharacterized protein n=1 Tax=Anaerotruncus colihominis DSM 17241 TaxID=445972 RepID=B0P8Z2_9FIRM|nr:hypothetical protein ANACOL_01239 [Anaerotruncus colihominis DSM 17241]